jgi:hypothetical protein
MIPIHRAAAMALVGALIVQLPSKTPAFAAANGPLQGGDLLVSNFHSPPGVFIFRQGSLAQTLAAASTTPNRDVRGASYTPTGKVVSTWDIYSRGGSGLFVFDPVTGGVNSIPTPQVVLPGDVSVMANGNYVVSDQWGRDIDVYSPIGAHLQTMNAPFEDSPTGNTIAPDGSIWVTVARSQDIFHFSPTGALLGSFRPGFNPGDIVVDGVDRTLWFPNIDSNTVHQFTSDGQELMSFPTLLPQFNQTFIGIAMTPHRDLYVSNTGSQVIYRYDRQGNLQATISNPGSRGTTYINVVIPEASSAALATGALLLLCGRQQRTARSRRPADAGMGVERSRNANPR